MSRFYVLDTSCAEFEEMVVGGFRGELLGIFRRQDSAEALAIQRSGSGNPYVVVVDTEQGRQVFPSVVGRSRPEPGTTCPSTS